MTTKLHATASKKPATAVAAIKKPKAIKTTPVAAADPTTVLALKKKRHVRPGTKAEREIRRYQKTTETLVPKAPLYGVIREIIEEARNNINEEYRKKRTDNDDHALKIQKSAMEALHTAAEDVMVKLLAKTRVFARHAGRVMIMKPDIRLAAHEMHLTKRTMIE